MSLHPASYEEALARKQASDARRKLTGRSQMKRTKMVVRRVSKKATVDGDSERDIRDECDRLVQGILRIRDCGCINHFCRANSHLHVGHYISRGVLAVRWDLENCNLQCDAHNAAHEYNTDAYRIVLAAKYGGDTVRRLERIGRENPRIEYVDLLGIRDGLRAELERMKKNELV